MGIGPSRLLTVLRRGGGLEWPQATSLVGLYLFDEGSGQIAHDTSGKKNHGQLGATGGAEATDPSWATEGLSFDGGDYVVLPGNGTLDVSADCTLMVAWYPTNESYYLFDGRDSGGHAVVMSSRDIYWYADGTPRFFDGDFVEASANNWHLGFWRLSANGGTPTLVLDSASAANGISTINITAITGNKYIGARRIGASYLTGKVGIVALWDSHLTADEITAAKVNVQTVMNDRGVGPDELVIFS
jgi:hypothetical protein